MKNGICDAGALDSFFVSSKSTYAQLNQSQTLDPVEADRAIAELREDLRL